MDTEVRIAQGTLHGAQTHHGVVAFKGIPYAAEPFGERRFGAPGPAPAWDGVRDAGEYGPTMRKPPYSAPLAPLLEEREDPGDECLNLNIWTPDLTGSAPVFVWIHGGAFVNGSGSLGGYDGSAFARDGVVCVTINYRLGAEGFLLIDGCPANRGLLDQLAALRWVRDNIACFGGDPESVTVAGESAGAMSVTTLLSLPESRGLFRRAIAQSGAGHHVMSAETARKVTTALADELGVPATAAGFGSVPVADFVSGQARLSARIAGEPDPAKWGEIAADSMAFEPCVDGALLHTRPIDAIAAGAGSDVALLTGTNADEFHLFLYPSGMGDQIGEDALALMVSVHGLDPERAMSIYHADRPGSTPGELLSAVLRDRTFWIPALRVAEARESSVAPTFVYEFDWRSKQLDGRLGAAHAMEISFVFDTLGAPGAAPLLGSQPPQALADAMHRDWVSFITSGHPGWVAYGADRVVRRFTVDPAGEAVGTDVRDPSPERRELWAGLR